MNKINKRNELAIIELLREKMNLEPLKVKLDEEQKE